VDEGEPISDKLLLELANRYADLSEKDRQILSRVANETNAAGRSISVTQRPTERRYAITQALCDWCDFGWDDEVVNAALVQVTKKVGSIGQILSKISTHHAEAFGQLAKDLTEGRVELAIGPDGITFTEMETT
jgi:TRAP-type C4-dicarboxylate transport system substrate-binding protein